MEGFQMYATRECSMLFQELHEKKGSVRSILGIFNWSAKMIIFLS